MTAFRVTPAELLDLAQQAHGTSAQIDSELAGLRSRVLPISATWSGQAQDRFQVLYDEWNRSAQGLQQALGGISQLLVPGRPDLRRRRAPDRGVVRRLRFSTGPQSVALQWIPPVGNSSADSPGALDFEHTFESTGRRVWRWSPCQRSASSRATGSSSMTISSGASPTSAGESWPRTSSTRSSLLTSSTTAPTRRRGRRRGCWTSPLPGPMLAGILNTAFLPELPDDVVVEVAAGAARLASWAASVELAATAEVTRRAAGWRGVGDRADQVPAAVMAAAEVGAALTLSPAAARNRVELARSLGRLQATRLALAGGRIDLTRARAMVDAVAGLSDEIAAEVEAQVIDRASTQTAAALKACLRRAVIRADPAAAEARRKTKVRERGVWREALDDGMARLEWTGPVEQVETTYTWLTAAALQAQAGDRAIGGPVRTLDQCRSDVMADLGDHALSAQNLPRQQGRRPQIGVLVGASTLLGLDDEPGELAGVGPVHASVARRIASDGIWRRLLTDPVTGALSHMSTDRYEPTQEIRDAVITRDQTCTGLGCRTRAERCDLDHRVPYPEGPTTADEPRPGLPDRPPRQDPHRHDRHVRRRRRPGDHAAERPPLPPARDATARPRPPDLGRRGRRESTRRSPEHRPRPAAGAPRDATLLTRPPTSDRSRPLTRRPSDRPSIDDRRNDPVTIEGAAFPRARWLRQGGAATRRARSAPAPTASATDGALPGSSRRRREARGMAAGSVTVAALRHRPRQAVLIVVLAAVVTGSAALGPLYARAVEQSVLRTVIADAAPGENALVVSDTSDPPASPAKLAAAVREEVPPAVRGTDRRGRGPGGRPVGHRRRARGSYPPGQPRTALRARDRHGGPSAYAAPARCCSAAGRPTGSASSPGHRSCSEAATRRPAAWSRRPASSASTTPSTRRPATGQDAARPPPSSRRPPRRTRCPPSTTSSPSGRPSAPRPGRSCSSHVDFPMRHQQPDLRGLAEVQGATEALDDRARTLGAAASSGLEPLLASVERQRDQARTVIPLLAVQLAVLGAVVLTFVCAAATEQRRPEIALARLRGQQRPGRRRHAAARAGPAGRRRRGAGHRPRLARRRGRGPALAASPASSSRRGGRCWWPFAGSLVAGLLAILAAGWPTVRQPLTSLLRRVPQRASALQVGLVEGAVVAAAAAGLVTALSGDGGPVALLAPGLLAIAGGLLLTQVAVAAAGPAAARAMRTRPAHVGPDRAADRPPAGAAPADGDHHRGLRAARLRRRRVGGRRPQPDRAIGPRGRRGGRPRRRRRRTPQALRDAMLDIDPRGRFATPVVRSRSATETGPRTTAVEPEAFSRIAQWGKAPPKPAQLRTLRPERVPPVPLPDGATRVAVTTSFSLDPLPRPSGVRGTTQAVQPAPRPGIGRRRGGRSSTWARCARAPTPTPPTSAATGCTLAQFFLDRFFGDSYPADVELKIDEVEAGTRGDLQPVDIGPATPVAWQIGAVPRLRERRRGACPARR